ncbi:RNA-binding protein L-like isoform X1 [Oryza sativa Japonica Group]|uniref:Os08g0190200 protein n=4 Tax=Oryza sativa subsp. japonica TaxID=39947 RepID=A0A0P0XCP2_ORYSJ|nr:Os08g0190200 [Oryza sativa Japonica Group]
MMPQPQPGMAPPPPPPQAGVAGGGGAPPQWGAIPPPVPHQQQQYAPPPPQMWGQAPPPPPQMWGQAPPPPQPAYGQPPPAQAGYYGAPPQAAPAVPAGPNEVRTLWIGDLQYWMDENYISACFAPTGELQSVKLIRDKQTGQLQGYGFIEFTSHAGAERVLQTYNGAMMPNVEQTYRLNWASAGEKRDDTPDYTIFVGDLAADVTDYILQETFRVHYPSVKGAKVVTDKMTMRSKGYGFVKFGDPSEQARAMTEMNGMVCSSRPMRIGPAANKKATGVQEKVPSAQGVQSDSDPSNTTIFVGGLDPSVTDDMLKQVFTPYGDVVHVKIPVGKRCGFVQFANRASADEALVLLQGTLIGGQNVRLSWGRSPSNRQAQPQQDSNQWGGANAGYYGYGQGYEGYGYAQPQDPNMYGYGAYAGYPNYQQPLAQQPQQQQVRAVLFN